MTRYLIGISIPMLRYIENPMYRYIEIFAIYTLGPMLTNQLPLQVQTASLQVLYENISGVAASFAVNF